MSDMTIEEQQQAVKGGKIRDNAIVVSNVVELATSVVSRVAGKDVADSIGKQSLSRAVLSNLVANRIKEKILTKE
jgi:hypothetical protein